jgi:hypothetical protein
MSNFVNQIFSKEDPIEVHCIRGENLKGDNTYNFLALCKSQVPELMIALKIRNVLLDDFGVVLRSGTGEPDSDTLDYIDGLINYS